MLERGSSSSLATSAGEPPTSRRTKKHIPLSFLGDPIVACRLQQPLPVVLVVDCDAPFSQIFRTLQRHITEKLQEVSVNPNDELPNLLRGTLDDFMLNQVQVDDETSDGGGGSSSSRKKGRIVEPSIQPAWTVRDLQHPSSIIVVRPSRQPSTDATTNLRRSSSVTSRGATNTRRIRFVGGPIRDDATFTMEVDLTMSFLELRSKVEQHLLADHQSVSLSTSSTSIRDFMSNSVFAPVEPNGVVGPYFPVELTPAEVGFDGYVLQLKSLVASSGSLADLSPWLGRRSSQQQQQFTSPGSRSSTDHVVGGFRGGDRLPSVVAAGRSSHDAALMMTPSTRTVRVLVPLVEQLTADGTQLHSSPPAPLLPPLVPLLPSSSLAENFSMMRSSSISGSFHIAPSDGRGGSHALAPLQAERSSGKQLEALIPISNASQATHAENSRDTATTGFERSPAGPPETNPDDLTLVRNLSAILDAAASPARLPPIAKANSLRADTLSDGEDVDEDDGTTRGLEESLSGSSTPKKQLQPRAGTLTGFAADDHNQDREECVAVERNVERESSSAMFKRRPDDLRTPVSQLPIRDDLLGRERPSAVTIDPMRAVMSSDLDPGFAKRTSSPRRGGGGKVEEQDDDDGKYSSDFTQSSSSSSSSTSRSSSSSNPPSRQRSSGASSGEDGEGRVRKAMEAIVQPKQQPLPPSATITDMLSKMPLPQLSRRVDVPMSKRRSELLRRSSVIVERNQTASAPLTATAIYTSSAQPNAKGSDKHKKKKNNKKPRGQPSQVERLLKDEPPSLFANVMLKHKELFDDDEHEHYKDIAIKLLGHAYSTQKDKAEAVRIAEHIMLKKQQSNNKKESPLAKDQRQPSMRKQPSQQQLVNRAHSLSPVKQPSVQHPHQHHNRDQPPEKKPRSNHPTLRRKQSSEKKDDDDDIMTAPSAITGIADGRVIIRGVPVLTQADLRTLLYPIGDESAQSNERDLLLDDVSKAAARRSEEARAEHLKRLHFALKVREELQSRLMDTPGEEQRSLQGTIATVADVNTWIDTWLEETRWRDARLDLFDAESLERLHLMREWRTVTFNSKRSVTAMLIALDCAEMAPVFLEEFSLQATNLLRESLCLVSDRLAVERAKKSIVLLLKEESDERRLLDLDRDKWYTGPLARLGQFALNMTKAAAVASSLEQQMFVSCKRLEKFFLLAVAELADRGRMQLRMNVAFRAFYLIDEARRLYAESSALAQRMFRQVSMSQHHLVFAEHDTIAHEHSERVTLAQHEDCVWQLLQRNDAFLWGLMRSAEFGTTAREDLLTVSVEAVKNEEGRLRSMLNQKRDTRTSSVDFSAVASSPSVGHFSMVMLHRVDSRIPDGTLPASAAAKREEVEDIQVAAQMALSELDEMPKWLQLCGQAVSEGDPSIAGINLSGLTEMERGLSERVIENLVALLAVRREPLKSVDLSGNTFPRSMFPCVLKLLPLVREVSLASCGLEASHESLLLETLSSSSDSPLQLLILTGNKLPASTAVSIARLLRSDKAPRNLSKILLAGNASISQNQQRLVQFLCDCNRHRADVRAKLLALEANDATVQAADFTIPRGGENSDSELLDDISARCVCAALISNRYCTSVSLRGQKLTDRAATLFSHLFKVNQALLRVDLSQNRMSDVGASQIAEALQTSNTTLLELQLDGNRGLSGNSSIIRLVKWCCLRNEILQDETASRCVLEDKMLREHDEHIVGPAHRTIQFQTESEVLAFRSLQQCFRDAQSSVEHMSIRLRQQPRALRDNFYLLLTNSEFPDVVDLGVYDGEHHPTDETISILVSAMRSNTHVRRLSIAHLEGKISPPVAVPLMTAIMLFPHHQVESLDMSHCGLTDHDMRSFAQAVFKDNANPRLRRLKLHGNKLTSAFAKDLLAIARSSSLLLDVTMYDNTDVSAGQCDVLSYYCELNMEGAVFKSIIRDVENDDHDLEAITTSASSTKDRLQQQLSHLKSRTAVVDHFSDNRLRLLSVALCKNKHVTHLDLSSSDPPISDEGAMHLAKCLRVNPALGYLDLSFNMLSDAGCRALENVIETQSYRKPLCYMIRFRGIQIEEDCCSELANKKRDGFVLGLCGNANLTERRLLHMTLDVESIGRANISAKEEEENLSLNKLWASFWLPCGLLYAQIWDEKLMLFQLAYSVGEIECARSAIQPSEIAERELIAAGELEVRRLLLYTLLDCVAPWTAESCSLEALSEKAAEDLFRDEAARVTAYFRHVWEMEAAQTDARNALQIDEQSVFSLLLAFEDLTAFVEASLIANASEAKEELLMKASIALDTAAAIQIAQQLQQQRIETEENSDRASCIGSQVAAQKVIFAAARHCRQIGEACDVVLGLVDALYASSCGAVLLEVQLALRQASWEPDPTDRQALHKYVDDVEADHRQSILLVEEHMFRTGLARLSKHIAAVEKLKIACFATFQAEYNEQSAAALAVLRADVFAADHPTQEVSLAFSPTIAGLVTPGSTSPAEGGGVSGEFSSGVPHHEHHAHLIERAMKHLASQPWDLQTKGRRLADNDPSTTALDISYAGTNPEEPTCTPDTIAILYTLTRHNHALREVNLSGNHSAITHRSAPLLLKMCAQTKLTSLHLADCGLQTSDFMSYLSVFLALPECHLITLTLDRNGIPVSDARKLCKGLRNNATVTTLHMAENLHELDKFTTDLLSFYVGANRYGAAFKRIIRQIEDSDPELKIVSITADNNQESADTSVSPRSSTISKLNDHGVKLLCIALSQNKVVEQLLLPRSGLTDKAAKYVAFLIKEPAPPPLRTVDLSSNDISDIGARDLLLAAEASRSLREVVLLENPSVSATTKRLLAAQLQQNAAAVSVS